MSTRKPMHKNEIYGLFLAAVFAGTVLIATGGGNFAQRLGTGAIVLVLGVDGWALGVLHERYWGRGRPLDSYEIHAMARLATRAEAVGRTDEHDDVRTVLAALARRV